MKVQCQTKKFIPTYDYPAAIKGAEQQGEIFWLPTEPKVEKDLHCIKTELSAPALHGVMTTLKLFTLYEMVAGNEYWGGRFKRMFPRPDFQRMAASFANVELNVHMPFYQRVDELLGLNTDKFYSSFTEDPILKARMEFLDEVVSSDDDLASVGIFSMVEGSILYSSFAFLMSFQANGNNQINNIHAGLTFSVKDENLHSEGGAFAFRTLLREKKEAGLTEVEEIRTKAKIYNAAEKIFEHESHIISMIFSKGDIKGINAEDLRAFVQHRINVVLNQLGLPPLYVIGDNPVAKWFYKMIGGDSQNDFFYSLGSSYNRNWSKSGFSWIVGGLKGREWSEINELI
jgi:ribonucleoside-diphosphate reductase beta chain